MEESIICDEEVEKKQFCFTQNASFLYANKQELNNLITE